MRWRAGVQGLRVLGLRFGGSLGGGGGGLFGLGGLLHNPPAHRTVAAFSSPKHPQREQVGDYWAYTPPPNP